MASNTTNLNLLKKDTVADANDTFNIETMLNENWDKIDQADGENVKKEVGKGLSMEDFTSEEKTKLAGIEDSATNYQHPQFHNASIITEDDTHRFVTTVEKSEWNESLNKVSDLSQADYVTHTQSLEVKVLPTDAVDSPITNWSLEGETKSVNKGDLDAGFFEIVDADDFITGDALISDIGLTSGISQNSNTQWIKYAYNGKICYTPMKTIRHSVTWDDIYNCGAVYASEDEGTLPPTGRIGEMLSISASDNSINTTKHFLGDSTETTDYADVLAEVGDTVVLKGWSDSANNGSFTVDSITDTKIVLSGGTLVDESGNRLSTIYEQSKAITQNKTVEIDSLTYKVRLMRGASNDPLNSSNDSDRDSIGEENEWNVIMLPLHERAELQNWNYPTYVGTTEYWESNLTDEDLGTYYDYGSGAYSWCQDVKDVTTWKRIVRGNNGVSNLDWSHTWTTDSDYGFRPVLERDIVASDYTHVTNPVITTKNTDETKTSTLKLNCDLGTGDTATQIDGKIYKNDVEIKYTGMLESFENGTMYMSSDNNILGGFTCEIATSEKASNDNKGFAIDSIVKNVFTSADEILTQIKTVDGVGSGLDAEYLCGVQTTNTDVAPTGTNRLNIEGELYATKVYNAVFNDYAEYFEKGEDELEAGDIIMINPSSANSNYVKSSGEYNKLVVGVISDEYAFCIGGNGDGKDNTNFVPIGLAGRVSVKIVGEIYKGDLIVSSHLKGIGMRANTNISIYPGCVIGKSLEDYDGSDGVKKIKMLIMNK